MDLLGGVLSVVKYYVVILVCLNSCYEFYGIIPHLINGSVCK